MRWFEGDISYAIAASKAKNAIFVVYVEGQDDNSKHLTSLIDDFKISNLLETEIFTAIKLEAESVSHQQFRAIYPNAKVPSLHFIGKNGHSIDCIERIETKEQLTARIDMAVSIHHANPNRVQNYASASETFITSEQQNQEEQVACENGVCSKVSNGPSTSHSEQSEPKPPVETEILDVEEKITEDDETSKELSKEDKIQRAKDLMEKKREIKMAEENENDRLKEIERRKMGKDVQKLHRWQQDQEMKTIMEERQRAKNEEKAARERILAQIAQDKAERALKFNSPPPQSNTTPSISKSPQNAHSNTARLQFRLPDGSSDTNDFENTATLQEVRNYVNANIRLPFRNYTLSTTFPRREFTIENNCETLQELELCPNAVILILPSHTTTISPNVSGGFMAVVWTLLSPIFNIFEYFRSLVFGRRQENVSPSTQQKRPANDIDQNPQQPQVKRKLTDSTVVRRQGNIHRLKDRTDSDEDNNTWNGNSTQQM